MLELSEAMAFLPSENLDRSEQFFSGQLNLPLMSRSPFACVFSCGETQLRVTKVDSLRPQPFTVFGWLVVNIHVCIEQLEEREVNLLRYEGVNQDEHGVWTTPNGDSVAWFKDPDLNVLSLTEVAA